jgi:hypothetical protein
MNVAGHVKSKSPGPRSSELGWSPIKGQMPDPLLHPHLAHDPRLAMDGITYRAYSGEHELPHIISLVQGELSEPYVVYTYRYFLHQWSVRSAFFSLTPHLLMLTLVLSLTTVL